MFGDPGTIQKERKGRKGEGTREKEGRGGRGAKGALLRLELRAGPGVEISELR